MKQRIRAIALAAALSAAPAALAQDAASQAGSVSGRVTVDGDPAAGVSVRLPWSDPIPNHPRPLTAVTDAEGRYRIEGVAPGKYFLAPFKPGYVGPNYGGGYAGKHVNVGPGEAVENVDVELTKGGVVSGRVSDEDGRPVVQAFLSLTRLTDGGGKEQAQVPVWRSLMTDDRGVYRVFGLPPGRYLVAVGGSGPGPGAAAQPRSYHPRGGAEADATPVTVTPGGETLGIDIAVAGSRKVYTASGVVLDEATGAPVANALVFASPAGAEGEGAGGAGGGEMRFVEPATTNSRGEFRLNGLAAGAYSARLQGFELMGTAEGWYSDSVAFTVDGDVAGLQVRARQGATVSGVLVVEGGADASVAAKLQTLAVVGSGPGAAAGPFGGGAIARVAEDGSFAVKGLPPGEVKLDVVPLGGQGEFRLRRVELNGAQVPSVTVSQGERVSGVRLVLGYGSGTVRGQVTLSGGSVPPAYSLVVELSEADGQGAGVVIGGVSGSPVDAPGMPFVRVDERGRFLAERVPPGTYEVNVVAIKGEGSPPVALVKGAKQRVAVTANQTSEVVVRVDLTGVVFGGAPAGGEGN